jgi:hypothetical protein
MSGKIHITIKYDKNGEYGNNPPMMHCNNGYGLRLWNTWAKKLGVNHNQAGYLIFIPDNELGQFNISNIKEHEYNENLSS